LYCSLSISDNLEGLDLTTTMADDILVRIRNFNDLPGNICTMIKYAYTALPLLSDLDKFQSNWQIIDKKCKITEI
jgi:hypothetical protein